MKQSLLAFGAAAALAAATPALAASVAGKAVRVPVVADVTGAAAVYGPPQKNAYELANDEIKAKRIDAGGAALTFDVLDSASDRAQVVNLMQKSTTDGSPLALGPTLSSEAFAGFPIAARASLAVVGTSTTAEGVTALGPCVFRVALAESQVIPTTVARTHAAWKYKTAAIIYGDDNAFTKTDGELFRRELKKIGADIVDEETFHAGDKDYQAALTRIGGKKPDVLAIGALFPEATKIIEQATKLGIKVKMMGGNGLNSPQMVAVAGPGAQGVVVGAAWYIGGKYSGNDAFVKAYKAKYGSFPDQFAAQSYAGAQVVASLVKNGATTKDEMCAALKNVKQINTVLGPIGFDPNRDVKSAPVILEVVKDGFKYFH